MDFFPFAWIVFTFNLLVYVFESASFLNLQPVSVDEFSSSLTGVGYLMHHHISTRHHSSPRLSWQQLQATLEKYCLPFFCHFMFPCVAHGQMSSIRVLSRGCSRLCWWQTPGDGTWTLAVEEGCCWPVAVVAVAPETPPSDSVMKEIHSWGVCTTTLC